jgi:hypothetical protein
LTRQTSRTWWTNNKCGAVARAEVGAGRIALGLIFDDQTYTVELGPAAEGPSAWSGSWTCHGKSDSGLVAARLYRTADGAFALIGDWNEDNTVFRWTAEFQAAR